MTTPARDSWPVLHCFPRTGPGALDGFLVEELAPLLDGLVAAGRAASWEFVRHEEGGAHLRVRVHGGSPARAAGGLARAAVGRAAAGAPPAGAGLGALSTRTAVACVAGTPRGGRRLAVAADLAHATAWALGMDRFTAARWLRGLAAAAGRGLPAGRVHAHVTAVYAAQRAGLAGRAAALREALDRGTAAGPVADWAAGVRAAAKTAGAERGGARAEQAGAAGAEQAEAGTERRGAAGAEQAEAGTERREAAGTEQAGTAAERREAGVERGGARLVKPQAAAQAAGAEAEAAGPAGARARKTQAEQAGAARPDA
ncbi:lantibiotic dehydratase C-terminal domain-containing protein, partial [Streptomyces sp. NPDC127110]|uniref:lantibiotic dehydratase C-terminal domain-containing protein n=1 Tax=Streptomyces sp. NPDC127110 TaxID=3345362 RepID=UPI0036421028